MRDNGLRQELEKSLGTIRTLQNELAETNRGLIALTMELENRVDARTVELRAAQEELQKTNSELLQMTMELEDRVAERTAQLSHHHATLNAILENSLTPVFSLDRLYRYTSFNTAHAAVMKTIYGAEIEIGQSMLEYQTVPEDREAARKNLDRALQGERIVESAYSGQPGPTRRYFEVAHSPICSIDGEVIGVSVFASDITEPKRAEASLKAYSTRLEADVAERTRELREAQEKMVRQERLATLGQIAGSVGHELRNPLGVISNAVYFLKMTQPDASATILDYLDIIEKETKTSDRIVTDLLDFTRIKSVDREPAAVSDLIVQTLQRYPAPASVEVLLDLPAELPPIYADPYQVVQVLGNLVTNACQAMLEARAGSSNLAASAGVPGAGKLTLSASQQSDMIVIAVKDTGVGIPPENMGKLFEPLFTTKIKGIGLGLAVSQKLAEANGGRIEAHSQPGQGSTFTVYLPVYRSLSDSLSGE
jgi:PAS domain S-box-containing protein